jgi:hypothetical protein
MPYIPTLARARTASRVVSALCCSHHCDACGLVVQAFPLTAPAASPPPQVDYYDYIDGMEPLLARLQAAGYPLHLMSNYPMWYRCAPWGRRGRAPAC